ncbi:putative cytochrome P450 49a1 [Chionoecetes opilio]|uniref:Putative cytochrome P450 49a1 n=1 Tax=Chionoecetes opilio TaxID=41210 RepID=A0A8J4Y091_CHIOP|nr:putative cytochrome P450 49a1 [Chionoecetes opilio]
MTQAILLRLWRPSGWRGSGSLLRFTSTAANAQEAAKPVLEEARPVSEMPGPRLSFPALMVLNRLKNDPDWNQIHKLWITLFASYGSIVRIKFPGFPPIVGLSTPDDCKELNRMTMNEPHRPPVGSLKKIRDNWTDDYFEKRGGIVVENGAEWWRVRSRVQIPLLKPMVVGEYVEEMDNVALTFVDRIKELQDKHGEMPENFQQELYKWALESVGVVALDRRFGCLGAPAGSPEAQYGEELIKVVNTLINTLAILELRFPVWRLFPTPAYNHGKLLRVVQEQVAQTVASLDQKGVSEGIVGRQTSVLQSLLATPGLTHKDIITFILDLVFGGIDTVTYSASSLSS